MIEQLNDKISQIFEEAKLNIKDPNLKSIVDRNFVSSIIDMKADVLICGINPSFRAIETNLNSYSFDFNHLENDRYFGKFHDLVKVHKDKLAFTYTDMFYQRHTEQKEIAGFYSEKEGIEFLCRQLIVTQEMVEQLKPKLILVFNKQAANFWGLNYQDRENIMGNVWLGYEFENTEIENLYRITGLLESKERLNSGLKATNLIGTLVYFSKFISYRTDKKVMNQIKSDIPLLINKITSS